MFNQQTNLENSSGSGNCSNATYDVQSSGEIASQPLWIISLIGSFLIIFTNLWIAIGFYHHAISTKVLKKKKSRRDVNGGLVMIMAMTAVVVPFFRYVGTLFFLFVSLNQELKCGCEIANDICVVGFGIAILPTYAFLWARQRAFYGHPSLGHMFGRGVSVFSHICIVLIVLTTVCALALGVYPREYMPGNGGCVLICGEEQDEYRKFVYAFVMISSQLILLGLFLHPIRLHAQQQSGLYTGSVSVSKSEITEFSATDGVTSSAEYTMSKSMAVNESPRPSTHIGNSNHLVEPSPKPSPSAGRSLSVPVNLHLRRISDDLAPHKKSSAVFNSEAVKGVKSRTGTGFTDSSKNGRNSFASIKVMTRFKKKVRRTTMKSRRVYRLIKRVLCLAIVSVLSDVIIMVIIDNQIPDDKPQTYSFVMYDFDLLINVATVVLSFENWKEMMLSPCKIFQRRNG